MGRIISILIILISAGIINNPFNIYAKKKEGFRGIRILKFPFYIFSYRVKESPFALSGYTGDVNSMRVEKIKDKYTGKACLRIIYTPVTGEKCAGWAGLYWQYPPNNWGDNDEGGYDLSEAKYLYFSARGKRGDEIIEVKVGGIKGRYGDSGEISTGYISLEPYWRIYRIELKERNLKNIIGGFGIFFTSVVNPYKITVYLNEIFYSKRDFPENKKWINLIKRYNRNIFSWKKEK